jgi:hypothetical protein
MHISGTFIKGHQVVRHRARVDIYQTTVETLDEGEMWQEILEMFIANPDSWHNHRLEIALAANGTGVEFLRFGWKIARPFVHSVDPSFCY